MANGINLVPLKVWLLSLYSAWDYVDDPFLQGHLGYRFQYEQYVWSYYHNFASYCKKKKLSHYQSAISARCPSPKTVRGIPLTHMQSPEEYLTQQHYLTYISARFMSHSLHLTRACPEFI